MLRFQFCLDRINRIYKIVFKQASPVLHAKILSILLILSKNLPAPSGARQFGADGVGIGVRPLEGK